MAMAMAMAMADPSYNYTSQILRPRVRERAIPGAGFRLLRVMPIALLFSSRDQQQQQQQQQLLVARIRQTSGLLPSLISHLSSLSSHRQVQFQVLAR
jgi:hypothetical protein